MPKSLKGFKKGDQGILYKASIAPWKVKRGEMSLLIFHVFNPKDRVLQPKIFVEKIEKKGFLGGTIFSPMSNATKYFWVPNGLTLDKMEKGDEVKVILPVFTNKSTESGDYKIYIDLKVPKEGITAGDVAKTVGKIALAFTVGYYKTKHYLPLKVLNSIAEKEEGKNAFADFIGIKIDHYGAYYPFAVVLDYRRTLELHTSDNKGLIEIITHKVGDTEERKNKLISLYKQFLIENPDETDNIDVNGIPFEFTHINPSSDKGSNYHIIKAVGFSESVNRIVYFKAVCKDNLYADTLNLFNSLEVND